MTTFKKLGLNSDLMKSLDDLGFVEPSPVQAEAIPFILESKQDLIALAQTGTGKTAAFSLPILNQIKANDKDLQAIILCPTRELCLQIFQDIKNFTKNSKGISVTAVYGGERIDTQIRDLKRGTNIVVGTPGRVHDLIRRNVLKLQTIQWLVLDEADLMLDMGFKEDLDAILEQTPQTRQTLLFSATMSRSVHSIAKRYMSDANEISIGEKNIGAEKVTHEYCVVQSRDRFEALKRILDSIPGVYGVLFCRTRLETQEVADKLKQAQYDAEALHGDVSQAMRTKIMGRFKRKQIRLLVATDVAARGIDVNDLTHVINYNLPDQMEIYTHRSGRTGRAKKSGVSISILTPRDVRRVRDLERIIGKEIKLIKVPDGEEVYKKQIDNFLEEIENTDIKNSTNEKYLSEIADKMKKFTKEELIKLFITHKFGHIIEAYKNARDLNTTVKSFERRSEVSDNINLKINFGKKNGFDIKSLFALINSSKKLQGIDIGTISLMSDHSFFAVDKKIADTVIKSLKGVKFKGNKVEIGKSDVGVEQPRRGRSSGFRRNGRSSGGFGQRRRGSQRSRSNIRRRSGRRK